MNHVPKPSTVPMRPPMKKLSEDACFKLIEPDLRALKQYRQIAKELNEAGYVTENGKIWGITDLSHMACERGLRRVSHHKKESAPKAPSELARIGEVMTSNLSDTTKLIVVKLLTGAQTT